MQNAIVKSQPTTAMVTTVQSVDDVVKLADIFAKSGMFQGESGAQSPAQLAVKIMAGQELGISPFAAANGMYIVKGKCAPGANLMAAKVKASRRYDFRVAKMTDTEVVIDFYEQGTKIGVSQFTAADAAKAGTQNMGKFPRNMLYARAMSNGVKWYCPDLFNGVAVYTPDEMGVTGEYDDGGEFVEVVAEKVVEPVRPVAGQRTPAAAVLNNLTVEVPQPAGDDSEKLRRQFHAEGTSTFGPLWDKARADIVHAVTAGEHVSSDDLTDAERKALVENFRASRRAWQAWAKSQGAMPEVAVREAVNPFESN